ncbi:MAG: ATP synthase subunit I [Burkholderiaceae bacterium]
MIAGEPTLLRALKFQWVAALLVAAVGAWFGVHTALSALAGGLAYAIPNSLFALTLMLKSRVQGANPVSFLLGEGMKIILTVAILGLINVMLPTVVWPAVIVGLIVVVKAQLLAFIFN